MNAPTTCTFSLDSLGLFGLSGIEAPLLAGLVTGDPILLVGAPGCAKTLLARQLARALGLRYHAYDASKALFEDIIGFPSPKALADGRIEYVPTALSLWDKEFILVDEVSRASPATANKWLEVIRSRRVMGMALPRLRQVIGAMNPPGSVGTIPLDLALADRFALHIALPEARDLGADDLKRVLAVVTEDDAPGLAHANGASAEVGLRLLLDEARGRYAALEVLLGAQVVNYVVHLSAALRNGRIDISARRCSMIYRSIVALLAVRGLEPPRLQEVGEVLRPLVGMSIPDGATGVEVRDGVIDAAHGLALAALGRSVRILTLDDPLLLARTYAKEAQTFEETQHSEVVSALETPIAARGSVADVARAVVALRVVLETIQSGRAHPPADVVQRAGALHERVLALPEPRRGLTGVEFDQARGGVLANVAFRVALYVQGDVRGPLGSRGGNHLAERVREAREELVAAWKEVQQ